MPKIIILSEHKIEFEGAKTCFDESMAENCDILLIMPNFNARKFNIYSKIAIVYGDLGFFNIKNIKYNNIITYGMSSKNTVTISSIGENEMLMAIQRQISSINGNTIEISEHSVKEKMEKPLDILATEILKMILDK